MRELRKLGERRLALGWRLNFELYAEGGPLAVQRGPPLIAA